MTAFDVLAEAERLGVHLTAAEGRLRVDAPEGGVSEGFRRELAGHKVELLAILSGEPSPKPWREALVGMPLDVPEAWGHRANELQDHQGLDWREAERVAFAEIAGDGPQEPPDFEERYLPARLDDDTDMGDDEGPLPSTHPDAVFTWISENDTRTLDALSEGVFAWCNDHPVSMWDSLEDGTKLGVTSWLDAHADELIAAIAQAVASRIPAG